MLIEHLEFKVSSHLLNLYMQNIFSASSMTMSMKSCSKTRTLEFEVSGFEPCFNKPHQHEGEAVFWLTFLFVKWR